MAGTDDHPDLVAAGVDPRGSRSGDKYSAASTFRRLHGAARAPRVAAVGPGIDIGGSRGLVLPATMPCPRPRLCRPVGTGDVHRSADSLREPTAAATRCRARRGLPHEQLAMVSRASVAGFTGHRPMVAANQSGLTDYYRTGWPARVATHACRAGQVPVIDPLGELQAVPTGTATCWGPAEALAPPVFFGAHPPGYLTRPHRGRPISIDRWAA